jgi:hypothetical protein
MVFPKQSFESVLRLAEPELARLIERREDVEQFRRVARLLPIEAVNFFGFERRLGGRSEAADCALNLTPFGARLLAERGLPGASSRAWTRVQAFFREWGATREPAFVDASSTWLEFDAARAEPEPNLLFGYWPNHPQTQRPLSWLLEQVLPQLLGAPLPPLFRRNLEKCFAGHSGACRDFQIGVMLARDVPAVRVCVFDLPAARAESYLQDLGWQGPLERVVPYLEALAPHADVVALHVDVGERIYPNLGIEPNFSAGAWARQPHLEPRWASQFEALLAAGLCTEAEREALLAFVGHQRREPLLAEFGLTLLRGLGHLKVVVRHDAVQAKAYFGLSVRETPREGEK